MDSLTRQRLLFLIRIELVTKLFLIVFGLATGTSLQRDVFMLEKKVYMKIEMGDYRSIFVPKSLSVNKDEFCECVEIFQHYMDETMDYLQVGNICEKAWCEEVTEDDELLVDNFDIDDFFILLETLYNNMGYLNIFNVGDYLCVKCKCRYNIPSSVKVTDSFKFMGLYYKEIK